MGTISFLSNEIIEEEKWTEKDTVWQAGCALLALACGKSPFWRDTRKKTERAIENCEADLSRAGGLKGVCDEILEAMKSAKDLNELKAALGKLGDGKSGSAEASSARVESASNAVEHPEE